MSAIRKNSQDLCPGGINERWNIFSSEKSLWLDEEETAQYVLFSLNIKFCSRTAVLGNVLLVLKGCGLTWWDVRCPPKLLCDSSSLLVRREKIKGKFHELRLRTGEVTH